MGNQINMSWDEVEVAIGRIIGQFKEVGYVPQHIVGVAKGGVIPASLIHQAYPNATFQTVQVKSYGHSFPPREPGFIGSHQGFFDLSATLIVDEIMDSGNTYQFLKSQYPECTYAFMSVRDHQVKNAPYNGWIFGRGWVIFPWEKIEVVEVPF